MTVLLLAPSRPRQTDLHHADMTSTSTTSTSSTSLVGAIDQGTSSSRFLVFDLSTSTVVAEHQMEIKTEHPHEGWAEQDPLELLSSVQQVRVTFFRNISKSNFISGVSA